MAKITAQFSNGFIDTYNGKRAVKAAWMITRKDTGNVVASGHSMDAEKARKTAAGNARNDPRKFADISISRATPKGPNWCSAYQEKFAREMGFKNHREHLAAWRAEVDRAMNNCAIEVIDL